jgi:phospholipid/cholesterol/gamma-HCH transport system substrate-binding protein
MKRRQLTRALAVAAIVVAVVVAVVVVTGAGSGRYELTATFDDVRGLIEGGDVRAGAVPVGTVTKVEIGPDERPRVTMQVDDDFRLRKGAVADVRMASNVGAVNRTVELIQGPPGSPRLRDGAHLTARSTDQPVNFDQAIETLNPTTRKRLGRLVDGLEQSVRGRGKDLAATLRDGGPALGNTADLLDAVDRDGEALRTVLNDGGRIVTTLARDPAQLGTAADRVAGLLQETAANRTEIRALVREMGPALVDGRRTFDAVTDATPRLRRLAERIPPVVDALDPFARLLPSLTAAAQPLVSQTERLVTRGPAQLRQLQPIARAATPVSRKLAPVAKEALPLARVLQVYVPETVGAFQNFGATAGAYDANGHILNVAATLIPGPPAATVAGGPLGAGDCDAKRSNKVKPGLLKKPYIRLPGVNECQPWTDLPEGILTPAKGGK